MGVAACQGAGRGQALPSAAEGTLRGLGPRLMAGEIRAVSSPLPHVSRQSGKRSSETSIKL